MKVCTDACIFGAWFSERIPINGNILDIGTGSGLLTLMLAQKTKGKLHGIEIDDSSFEQSKDNIAQSGWKDRISLFKGDASTYTYPLVYDFIITNPPFYDGELKSPDIQKNLAMHSTGLTLEILINVIDQNLTPNGSFGMLIPYYRTEEFIAIAHTKGFFLAEKLLIKQTPAHNYFRGILHFTRSQPAKPQGYELIIKNNNADYTHEFTNLLKDYYLYL